MIVTIKANATAMAKKIGDMRKRLGDATPITRVIADEMRSMAATSFATRTAPSGEAWPPAKPGDGADGETLRTLSIIGTPNSVRVHVGSSHASFVQWGTKHMRPRAFLPVVFRNGRAARMTRGEAAKFWKRTTERIKAWVVSGKRA